jgi:hypothetical protein
MLANLEALSAKNVLYITISWGVIASSPITIFVELFNQE